MAQVPSVPLPNVSPSTAPVPLQNLNAPPLAFGANAGSEQLASLGKAASDTSDILTQHANTFQALVNKQQADDGFTRFIPALNEMKTTFQDANKGSMDAVLKLPDLYKNIEQLRAQGTAGLSPVAAQEYNTQTRRYLAGEQATLSTWAVTQKNVAIEKSTNSVIDLTSAQMAAHPGDATVQANGAQMLGQQAAILAHQNNWTSNDTKDFLQKVLGKVYVDQAQNAIAAGDLGAAQAIRDQHVDLMTADQLNTINRSLGVKEVSATAINDAMAIRTGTLDAGGAPSDPKTVVAPLLSLGATMTSGTRTPEHNAEVGGVANSYHLTGHAADLVPPPGMSMAQLAQEANTRLPGAKVINEGTHVHVQWGGKTASSTPASPLTLQSNEDPNAYLARVEPVITQLVQSKYPGNPTQQQASFNSMMTAARQQASVANETHKATYTQLGTAILDGNIQDEAGLASAYPNAAANIANLPPNYQLALKSDLKHNANEVTPARYGNIEALTGLQHDNPQAFVATDLTKVDLPSATRLVWMKTQETTKAQLGKAQKTTQLQTVLSYPQTQAAMNGLGISKKDDPDTYYQFVGAIATELEHFQGKATPKDIQGIVSNVTATAGQKKGLFGSTMGILGGAEGEPSFKVPQEEHDAIVASLEKRGLNTTNEALIASIYREKHRGR